MRRRPSGGLLLGQRHRRWGNSKQTLSQCLMFAGLWACEMNVHAFTYCAVLVAESTWQ